MSNNRLFSFLMKHQLKFYVLVGFCVLLVVLLPFARRIYDQRHEYDWSTKHLGDIKSEDPFGAKYLLDYVKEQWKGKISVECNDLKTALETHKKETCNYLIIGDFSDSIECVLDAVYAGNKMLFGTYNSYLNFAMSVQYSYNSTFNIESFTTSTNNRRVNIYLKNTKKVYDTDVPYFKLWSRMEEYSAPEDLIAADVKIEETDFEDAEYVEVDTEEPTLDVGDYSEEDSKYDYYKGRPIGELVPLLTNQNDYCLALRRDLGKGSATLIGTDYLFTNYGIQNPETRMGVEHLMLATFDDEKPLIVVYFDDPDYNDPDYSSSSSKSALYVLLKNPASALFLWLLLAGLILLLLINSKRRQRPKNQLNRVRNSSIVYIRHLATLYSKKTDYNELLQIEHKVLFYRLRKEYLFDIRTKDYTRLSQFAEHVANSKKLNVDDVRKVFQMLETLSDKDVKVSRDEYKACIQSLDNVI